MRVVKRINRVQIALLTMAAVALFGTTTTSADEATSIANAGSGSWTTPQVGSTVDYVGSAAPRYTIQEAPRAVPATTYYAAGAPSTMTPAVLPGTALSSGPTWAAGAISPMPAAEITEIAAPDAGATWQEWPTDLVQDAPAAPMAAPYNPAPYTLAPAPVFESAPMAAPAPAPFRSVAGTRGIRSNVNPNGAYTGCGLPCMQGISEWHVRAVFGRAFFLGDDSAEPCTYAGLDIGRTFCGCWGLDAYYRYNSGRFDRTGLTNANGALIRKDGGHFHHVGLKFTMERGFSKTSKWFWWGGLGGGYFWTEDYVDDDSGAEIFAEGGVGYLLTRNIRLRAGFNAHGMNTSVGRRNLADRGRSRMLWVIAPVVEIEFSF